MPLARVAAVLLLATAPSAQAVLLLDTGSPPASLSGLALYAEQSLGASFHVPVSTVITAIEGFIGVQYAGTLSAVLYAGDPGGTPVGSQAANVSWAFDPRWVAIDGLSWAVAPGTYTLTFQTGTFQGYMPTPSPGALDVEWNLYNGVWSSTSGVDGLGIRVHVSVVSEPSPTALLAAGALFALLCRLTQKKTPSA
jgi:hypothetical protein